MLQMLRDVYGKGYDTNATAQSVMASIKEWKTQRYPSRAAAEAAALRRLERRPSAPRTISLEEFQDFIRTHQALIWPAFTMQQALRNNIMGISFWKVSETACAMLHCCCSAIMFLRSY
jgi:hypothetical protein